MRHFMHTNAFYYCYETAQLNPISLKRENFTILERYFLYKPLKSEVNTLKKYTLIQKQLNNYLKI